MHCCLLSSCMSFFVVLYFVTSFIFCDLVFCGFFYCEFHGGQNICQHDVSRTRGLYVYSCSSRIAFQLSRFCLPFLKPFYAVPLSIGPKNKICMVIIGIVKLNCRLCPSCIWAPAYPSGCIRPCLGDSSNSWQRTLPVP